MNALKGILAGVLSFLLLVSLSLFGIALMINCTALNPDFVTRHVEEADISQLASDFVDENYIEDIPEDMLFFKDVVYQVIEDHEPWLKEQFSNAANTGYDYMLGNTSVLDIRIPLDELKETVKESTWLHFMEMLPEWIADTGDEGLRELIYDNVYDFAEDIPEGYLPTEYQSLSESQLRGYVDLYFDDIADQTVDGRLPPSLEAEIEDLLLPYFNQYYDEIVEEIPSEFVINESEIDDEEAWQIIEDIRRYIGYFKAGFYGLIGLIVLLIALIVLVHRNFKDSIRTIGITFLVYGITEFIIVILARTLVPNYIPFEDIPLSMQNLILDIYKGVLAPVQWFSLGIMIAGIILFVSSFFFKRPDSVDIYHADEPQPYDENDINDEEYQYTD